MAKKVAKTVALIALFGVLIAPVPVGSGSSENFVPVQVMEVEQD